MRSGFRICESLRSRQGLVSKAQGLDEAFASKEIRENKETNKPGKSVTVGSMAGQPSCLWERRPGRPAKAWKTNIARIGSW